MAAIHIELGHALMHRKFQTPAVALTQEETVLQGNLTEVDGVGSIDWDAFAQQTKSDITPEERAVLSAVIRDTCFAYALVETDNLGRMTEAQASFEEHLRPGLGGKMGPYVEAIRKVGVSKRWNESPELAVDLNRALWEAAGSVVQPLAVTA